MLKVLIPLLITTFMFQAGLDAPPGSYRRVSPVAIGRGLVLMLVVGPALAWGLTHLLSTSMEVTVGLVVLSVVGVMPLAWRSARRTGGGTTTGVVFTILLGQIAVFTALPSAELLLQHHGGPALASGRAFLRVLLLQGLPLVAGILVARRLPRRAPALSRLIAVLDAIILVAVLLFAIVPKLGVVRVLTPSGGVSAVVFAVVFALLAALLGGPAREDRRALLAISASANIGLALTILEAAGLERRFGPTLAAIFLVRVVVGTLMEKLIARDLRWSSRRPAPPRHVEAA